MNLTSPCNPLELSVAVSLTELRHPSVAPDHSVAGNLSSLEQPRFRNTGSTTFRRTSTSSSNTGLTFPQVLFNIISNPAYSDIVTWLPNGECWVILDKDRFASQILPVFFKQSHFTSFMRRLTRWKFKRIAIGHYMGAYHHKFFQRDSRHLCHLMSCRDTNEQVREHTSARLSSRFPFPNYSSDKSQSYATVEDQTDLRARALKYLEESNKLLVQEHILKIRLRKAQLLEHSHRRTQGNMGKDIKANDNWRKISRDVPTFIRIRTSHKVKMPSVTHAIMAKLPLCATQKKTKQVGFCPSPDHQYHTHSLH